jgi:putative ABC transport system permease protein
MDWKSHIRAALREAVDHDVLEELAQHASSTFEAARAEGCTPDEAMARVDRYVAEWRRDASMLRHRSRRPLTVEPPAVSASRFAGVPQDLKYAARLLRRRPAVTLVAILTIALGIGATTVLFSATYGVLMKPLPWPDADRLVRLAETRGGRAPRFGAFTNALYLTWRDQSATLDGLAAWSVRTVTMASGDNTDRVSMSAASANLLPMLGARVSTGRLLGPQDEAPGAEHVVVLSAALWRDRFGSSAAAVGTRLHVDGQPYRIVGVLEPQFVFLDRDVRMWTAFVVPPASGNYLSLFNAVGRLRPGVTPAQAAAEGRARGRVAPDSGLTTTAIFGGPGDIDVSVVPLLDAMTVDVRRALLILLAAVVLLMITATANIASLQLARAAARRRELAVRAALGAGAARLAGQLLVENLFISAVGGLVGLGLAAALHRALPSILPADFPRAADIGIDAAVLGFAFAVSMIAGVAFGVLPALGARRLDLAQSLAENATAPVGGRLRLRTSRTRALIIAGQVAIACVLLVCGTLLVRSFTALMHADRGYDPSGVLTARVAMPGPIYTAESRLALVDQMLARLAATPAVTDAAFASEMPLRPSGSTSAFTLRSSQAGGGTIAVQASPRIVSPRAFSAMGMRIIAGRGFTDADTASSQPVVIVNRTFARRYLGDSPVGARLPMGVGYQDGVEGVVAGVVEDTRSLTAVDPPQPEMYFSYRQFKGRLPVAVVTLVVRTNGDPAALASALRTVIREADPGLVAEAVRTMEDSLRLGLARPRLYAVLLAGFAVCALLIAGVGLFGVLSYTVAQRSREIAVRSALGASPQAVVRLVVRQGLTVTVAGIATGLAASLILTDTLSKFLFGVTPRDPLTFLLVPVLLVVVAGVACFVPARRAAAVDPVSVLRS